MPGVKTKSSSSEQRNGQLLATLAEQVEAAGHDGDDGIVHFYEKHDANDGSYQVVFPYGFEHADGGPCDVVNESSPPDVRVESATEGAKPLHEKNLAQEWERIQKTLKRLELEEEEARDMKGDHRLADTLQTGPPLGAMVDQSSSAKTAPVDVQASVKEKAGQHAQPPRLKVGEAPAKNDFGTGMKRGFLLDARGGSFARDVAETKQAQFYLEPKRTSSLSLKSMDVNVDGSAGANSASAEPNQSTWRRNKRVSFAEPLETPSDCSGSRGHAPSGKEAIAGSSVSESILRTAPPPRTGRSQTGAQHAKETLGTVVYESSLTNGNSSILDAVEGATLSPDEVLTSARLDHINEMLALEAERGSEDDSSTDSEDFSGVDNKEYGFISQVLGPDRRAPPYAYLPELPTPDGRPLPDSHASFSPEVVATVECSGDEANNIAPGSSCSATYADPRTQPAESVLWSSAAEASVKEDSDHRSNCRASALGASGDSRPEAALHVSQSTTPASGFSGRSAPSTSSDAAATVPVRDVVVERSGRRRLSGKRDPLARRNGVLASKSCIPHLDLRSSERQSAIEPVPKETEEDTKPRISKFKQLRDAERTAQ